MTRAALAAALAATLVPAPAAAADRGVVVARVVHGETGKPVAGARVALIAGRSGSGLRRTTRAVTGESGRVRFDRLATGDERFYALDAVYDGGYFAGGNVALPDDTARAPVVRATLRVWPTTSDAAAILVARDDLFAIQARDGTVGVVESVTVLNQTRRAYVGRGAAAPAPGTGRPASLGFALPDGAAAGGVRVIRSSIDVPEIRPTEYGFATTVAIPPGETQTTFTYSVPGSGGTFDLGRTALYPIVRLSVHAAAPLEVRSNRLREDGEVTVGGRTYLRWSNDEAVDAGDPVQVVAAAGAGTGGVVATGAAALAVLVVAGVALAALRRRRGPRPERPGPDGRREVLLEIARLDVARERGELTEDAWSRRRAELKERLADHAAPEPR